LNQEVNIYTNYIVNRLNHSSDIFNLRNPPFLEMKNYKNILIELREMISILFSMGLIIQDNYVIYDNPYLNLYPHMVNFFCKLNHVFSMIRSYDYVCIEFRNYMKCI